MDEPNVVILGNLEEGNIQLPDPNLWLFYKDLDNRVLWLDSEVCEDTLTFIKYILKWNKEDAGVPVEQRKPIKILVHSVGGSLDVADAVCSTIALSKTPVYGYAVGLVASAASLIYLSCHKRFSLKTAYFVLHKGSASMGGNYNEIQAAMEDYQKQVDRMVQFYIEHTNFPADTVKEKIKTDWYVHSDEALEHNLVNEIVTDINELL